MFCLCKTVYIAGKKYNISEARYTEVEGWVTEYVNKSRGGGGEQLGLLEKL